MTREELKDKILNISQHNILLELPTGIGKSKCALDIIKAKSISKPTILVVVPRNVLKETWRKEFIKWKCEKYLFNTTFVTYISLPKIEGSYDFVVFDECHHLSERCLEALSNTTRDYSILLSATVNRNTKIALHQYFTDLITLKIQTREAIKSEILPDPKVLLIPLQLDNTKRDCIITRNPKRSNAISCYYEHRWQFIKEKTRRINILCTQAQYYKEQSSLIEYYKKRSNSTLFRNLWLSECGKRLKWLSEIKTSFILTLLGKLYKERTLTFCSSIAQTELLGTYCINSKNKDSKLNLSLFNSGKINQITACDILNEGVNLHNCRIGVYAALNSSERIIKQKLGRLLRHPDPILIIPYYKDTRDEEIVLKMCEDYNPELIKTVSIDNIKDYL